MQVQSCKFLGNRNRVSGFLRLFVLSLLAAAFACTSLQAQTVAYVTNILSNSVSVIDTSTNTVTATIGVGSGPLGVVLTPDGTRAYVANDFGSTTGGSTVSVIDTASNTVIATVHVNGSAPGFPAITPDGKSVYVPTGAEVDVIDTASNSVAATISLNSNPGDIAITPDGTRAYVLGSNEVDVIDTATNAVVQSITVSSSVSFSPVQRIAMSPDGSTVYIGGGTQPLVQAIATSSNSVVATIPLSGVGLVPGLAISPDGGRVYVSALGSVSGLRIIDTATNTLEPGTITVNSTPFALAFTPDGAFVYVTNGFSNNVSAVSTATNTVVATIPVGSEPQGIVIANLSTPFSNLTINSLTVNQNGYATDGTFSLGAASTGIDLAHQPLTLTVNGSSITIPAGSFKQVGGNFHFVFNGLTVSFNLMATGGTSTDFKFSATVTGTDLTGGPNPATVSLKIGSNSGSTTAPF